jgi:hypothetical protein
VVYHTMYDERILKAMLIICKTRQAKGNTYEQQEGIYIN